MPQNGSAPDPQDRDFDDEFELDFADDDPEEQVGFGDEFLDDLDTVLTDE